VFAFAQSGAVVSTGLDLSPEATAAATAEQHVALAADPAASSAVHLTAGDFFRHAQDPGFKGPYDIGYDYTFLCALHPGRQSHEVTHLSARRVLKFLRQDWSLYSCVRAASLILGLAVHVILEPGLLPLPHHPLWRLGLVQLHYIRRTLSYAMATNTPVLCPPPRPPPTTAMHQDRAQAWSHIIAPGGELVTLMFPVGGTPEGAPRNPPWPVTPELYKELLLPAGKGGGVSLFQHIPPKGG
jgi:hypothetical protein